MRTLVPMRSGVPIWVRGVLVLVVGWMLAVSVTSWRARDDLSRGRQALLLARDALTTGELAQAQASLGASAYLLERSDHRLSGWHVRAASAIPLVGPSLRTARTIADAAADLATSGNEVTSALVAARGEAASGDGGGLPVGAIDAVGPPLAAVADALTDAVAEVRASPASWLLGSVADGRREFLELAAPLAPDVAAAAALVRDLPVLLGADGPATYLFGVSNPAEQRGTGGYVGSYSRLVIDDGHLEFGDFRETSDLERPARVTGVDASVVARYGPFGVPTSWQNVNFTPDFPTAAGNLAALWRASFGEELDGVIVVDPEAFARLLEMTGPVTSPTGTVIAAEDAAAYLANGAFVDIEDNELRKLVLGAIAADTLQAFLGEIDQGEMIPAGRALGELLTQRHVQVWFADRDAERSLAALREDGGLHVPNTGELLAVTINNASATKIDFYLDRTLHHRVTLLADGWSESELDVELTLDAPTSGLPTRVIGPTRPELDAGEALHWLSAYCAPGCAMTQTPISAPGVAAQHGPGGGAGDDGPLRVGPTARGHRPRARLGVADAGDLASRGRRPRSTPCCTDTSRAWAVPRSTSRSRSPTEPTSSILRPGSPSRAGTRV